MFVDDIQWADASLRDVVLYLVAGPRNRRLAVVATARTTGLPDGHPVHGWLADVLRFSHVKHLEIGPLSRSGTEGQLAGLLGGRTHQSLVEDVYRAGRGNPYLTFLLAKDGTSFHLDLVGEDTLHGEMQGLANKLGLDPLVTFHGFQTQRATRAILESAHVHVV